MPIYIGSTEQNKIYLGSTEIKKVYVGSNQVFSATTVTLSGETIEDPGEFGSKFASVRVNTDGTVDQGKQDPAIYSQIDASTDWIIPNEDASSSYDIRMTGLVGTTPTGPAENTWVDLGTNREWSVNAFNDATPKTATFTLEIRIGGNTVASASYTITAGGTGGGS